ALFLYNSGQPVALLRVHVIFGNGGAHRLLNSRTEHRRCSVIEKKDGFLVQIGKNERKRRRFEDGADLVSAVPQYLFRLTLLGDTVADEMNTDHLIVLYHKRRRLAKPFETAGPGSKRKLYIHTAATLHELPGVQVPQTRAVVGGHQVDIPAG